jgi:hypothetical protein
VPGGSLAQPPVSPRLPQLHHGDAAPGRQLRISLRGYDLPAISTKATHGKAAGQSSVTHALYIACAGAGPQLRPSLLLQHLLLSALSWSCSYPAAGLAAEQGWTRTELGLGQGWDSSYRVKAAAGLEQG